jgi:hypothetical protein
MQKVDARNGSSKLVSTQLPAQCGLGRCNDLVRLIQGRGSDGDFVPTGNEPIDNQTRCALLDAPPHNAAQPLSSSTVLYILIDGGGECFCTSRLRSASRTSDPYIWVWEGVPPYGSGGPVVVVSSLFSPRPLPKISWGRSKPPGLKLVGAPAAIQIGDSIKSMRARFASVPG